MFTALLFSALLVSGNPASAFPEGLIVGTDGLELSIDPPVIGTSTVWSVENDMQTGFVGLFSVGQASRTYDPTGRWGWILVYPDLLQSGVLDLSVRDSIDIRVDIPDSPELMGFRFKLQLIGMTMNGDEAYTDSWALRVGT